MTTPRERENVRTVLSAMCRPLHPVFALIEYQLDQEDVDDLIQEETPVCKAPEPTPNLKLLPPHVPTPMTPSQIKTQAEVRLARYEEDVCQAVYAALGVTKEEWDATEFSTECFKTCVPVGAACGTAIRCLVNKEKCAILA